MSADTFEAWNMRRKARRRRRVFKVVLIVLAVVAVIAGFNTLSDYRRAHESDDLKDAIARDLDTKLDRFVRHLMPFLSKAGVTLGDAEAVTSAIAQMDIRHSFVVGRQREGASNTAGKEIQVTAIMGVSKHSLFAVQNSKQSGLDVIPQLVITGKGPGSCQSIWEIGFAGFVPDQTDVHAAIMLAALQGLTIQLHGL